LNVTRAFQTLETYLFSALILLLIVSVFSKGLDNVHDRTNIPGV